MDIAVVDDEKAIREHIRALIEEKKPGSRIEAYSTGEELLASGKRFDIVFLDIQMDGMNGIEAARDLRQRQEDTVLIFITGIREYAFDALDLYAFHYLLKPVDEGKFAEMLERAAGRQRKRRKGSASLSGQGTLRLTSLTYCISRAGQRSWRYTLPMRIRP